MAEQPGNRIPTVDKTLLHPVVELSEDAANLHPITYDKNCQSFSGKDGGFLGWNSFPGTPENTDADVQAAQRKLPTTIEVRGDGVQVNRKG